MLGPMLTATSLLGMAHIASAAAVSSTTGGTIFVSSYNSKVTTLNIGGSSSKSGVPKLSTVAESTGCGESPSWLTLDKPKGLLYCVDENIVTGGGNLASLRTKADGSLEALNLVKCAVGPVSIALYGKDNHGLAVAHYGGSAFSTWDATDPAHLVNIQTETFKMTKPPADPPRQPAPRPHETYLDPTNKFIVVPDLGTDELRLYAIGGDGASLTTTKLDSVAAPAGSGPRHVAFVKRAGRTFMYLVTELSSQIVGYEVTYPAAGKIAFKQLWVMGAHGWDKPTPKQAYASEIVISPDSRFAIVSSRNENSFKIPNFDPTNSTQLQSDPLINFRIDDGGGLTAIQEVAAGGSYPRQFSINKAGTLLGVGLQLDNRVALVKRDPASGKLGGFAGYAQLGGQITSVIFNE
ncbi:3-carboxymuconate cyclase [Purpureocillium lavendulum]|uniref:3-carboxymuconate cyclase n=1 Tax=Purpureocillium lavendulum TaxID=1247861 RepID=A0AB34FZ81_9HYPO|nr:3-carboxymuconate cyclase [Purpureocillium lavendulum]